MRAIAARLPVVRDIDAPLAATLALGVAGAVVLGAAVATIGAFTIAALVWLLLVVLGLRYPAVPLVAVLLLFGVISDGENDNPFVPQLQSFYEGLGGSPATPGDFLIAAGAVGALGAWLRLTHAERRLVWSPLSAPILAFAAAGLLSTLVFHRDGKGGLIELAPTLRFAALFLIASVVFAAGALSRPAVLRAAVILGQIVAVIGIINTSLGGSSDPNSITAGGASVALAFFDSASPFVMVVALAVIMVRALWGPATRRLPLALAAVLPLAGLLLSVRRAMWLDLLVAAAIILAVSVRGRRRTLISALGVVLVVFLAFFALGRSSPAYAERLQSITSVFSQDTSDANVRSRQIETRAVWRNIKQQPILGIGLTAPYKADLQFEFQNTTYLHNNVLWVWLKFGLLGLLALVWMIWRTITTGLQAGATLAATRRLSESQGALAAMAVTCGFFVAMLTASFLTASGRFPIMVGVAMAVISTAWAARRTGVQPG